MRKLGEFRKQGTKGHTVWQMWAACWGCGHERWVRMIKGKLRHLYCRSCSKQGHLNPMFGKAYSEEEKSRLREAWKGPNNPNYKGGRKQDINGYISILMHNHPNVHRDGCVFEHRFVMEQAIGRYLDPNESVHHINGIKSDNRIENLLLFENEAAHQHHHKRVKDYIRELLRKT